jgi:hypothetical protein
MATPVSCVSYVHEVGSGTRVQRVPYDIRIHGG